MQGAISCTKIGNSKLVIKHSLSTNVHVDMQFVIISTFL